MSDRKPYAPISAFDGPKRTPAPAGPRPTLEPAPNAKQPPKGVSMDNSDEDSKSPQAAPGLLVMGGTAVGALTRKFGGEAPPEAKYALWFLASLGGFVQLAVFVYAVGHGWFGFFGCPKETMLVQPYEGPTKLDTLRQGEK